MKKRLFLLLPLLLAACTPTAQTPPTSSPAPAPAHVDVTIDNFTFQPQTLTIPRNTTVTFTNKDDVPHTATSSTSPPAFDSKTLDTDDHFSFTFTTPGTYPYFCKVHPHMTATITVQ